MIDSACVLDVPVPCQDADETPGTAFHNLSVGDESHVTSSESSRVYIGQLQGSGERGHPPDRERMRLRLSSAQISSLYLRRSRRVSQIRAYVKLQIIL